jgi:hypothetical protein
LISLARAFGTRLVRREGQKKNLIASMKTVRPNLLRISRRLKQFNLSLVCTLAALALAGCGIQAAPQPIEPSTSIAKGVQQILHRTSSSSVTAARTQHVAARSL